MGSSPNDFDDRGEPLSLKESLSFFKETAGEYISARKELLALEAQEAGEVVKRKLTLLAAFAVAAFFAYGLFLMVLVGIGSILLKGRLGAISEANAEWLIMAALLLVLHIFAIMLLLMRLKEKGESLFPMSKAELNKDKQWLEENN